MKTYTAKSLDEAIEMAAQEKCVATSDITYFLKEEKQGFLGFGNQVSIEAYAVTDVLEFLHTYLNTFFMNMELPTEVTVGQDSNGLKVMLNAENNAILIGKNGQTLQALNTVVRHATNAEFKKRFNILIDINNYKTDRYDKVIAMANRIAKTVLRTKVAATLDPLPNDERKVIHQYLGEMDNIRTESVGEGRERRLKIVYDEKKKA
jgi:spoIIIJ-associated protein